MKSIKLLIVFVVFLSACKSKYPDLEDGLYADIQTNIGDVLVKLHYEKVPMTVANFVALAEGNHPKLIDSLQGIPFYDGLKFHRVIKNFMIQGGDAKGTERGSVKYYFEDEFPSDLNGKLFFKHDKPGVLSMANSGPNTNLSQFFITHKPTPWLDDKHSVFGNTILGQNIVDSIQKGNFIKKLDIIRIGSDAKNFEASSVFIEELGKAEIRDEERKSKILLARKLFQQKKGIDKAIETNSGLKVLNLKKGNGQKVNPALPTTAHYSLYTTNGKKIDSSLDRDTPIVFILNKNALIAGWKEGVSQMVEGEKSRLFIPSYLGYGSIGEEPFIQPNEDLILEIEILKVGK